MSYSFREVVGPTPYTVVKVDNDLKRSEARIVSGLMFPYIKWQELPFY
jgi:hypothetical protein